ncbi:MAG: InlB B-repeat-containing protein [Treponema sp.]|nr:InlB B-repeat-containing protein [Treponema sp.]MCL2251539.1 InlB B-repeat-containing protein [Treponema sp.]
MKKTWKLAGIIAFLVIIGGIILACEQSSEQEQNNEIIIYVVEFNINGGTGTVPDEISVNMGSSITLPNMHGFTNGDYSFNGWNTHPDGLGISYQSNSSYIPTESITLYAKWEAPIVPLGYTVAEKLAWLKDNAESNRNYIVEVNFDENISSHTFTYSNNNITVIIRNTDKNITFSSITISSDCTLILEGNSTCQNNLIVNNNGKLIINNGVKISGVSLSNSSFTMNGGEIFGKNGVSGSGAFTMNGRKIFGGNGVSVGGTFTMNGGEIFGGNGVSVGYGTFIMSDGKIYENSNNTEGGVVSVTKGTFTMSGGIITNNTNGGGGCGGVYIEDGTFKMTGGEISYNSVSYNTTNKFGKAFGVYIKGGTFTMIGGEISNNFGEYCYVAVCIEHIIKTINYNDHHIGSNFTMEGGKIYNNSGIGVSSVSHDFNTFTMTGGEISGNQGSGVSARFFTMTGGEIFGNQDSGVRLSKSFTMTGGKISGNQGSGVEGRSSYITMSGGEISGNTGSDGGGVYAGTFTMSGGEIYGNNAAAYGGGVYVGGLSAPFTMSMSGGEIYGNSAGDAGGGVCGYNYTLTKTGGTIYGYTMGNNNSNVVKDVDGNVLDDRGHAVVVYDAASNVKNRRETTAGLGDNLYTAVPGAPGGWEN